MEIGRGRPTTRRYTKEAKDQAVRLVSELRKELETSQETVVRIADQMGSLRSGGGLEPRSLVPSQWNHRLLSPESRHQAQDSGSAASDSKARPLGCEPET